MNKKSITASFLAGATCTAIAFLFAPEYWLMGTITGIFGGQVASHISYDFGEFLRAVKTALSVSVELWELLSGILKAFAQWLVAAGPILLPIIILTATRYIRVSLSTPYFHATQATLQEVLMTFASVAVIMVILVNLGVNRCHRYWQPSLWNSEYDHANHVWDAKVKGYKESQITYLLAIWWILVGIAIVLRFVIKLLIVLWVLTPWQVYLAIRSRERALCGLYGSLGGLISFFAAPIGAPQILFILFGGTLGVALGMLDKKVIAPLFQTKALAQAEQ